MELCKTCHGGCCRRYNPHLWGSDIIKICTALNVDINFFVDAIPISGDKLDNLLNKMPLLIFTDSGEEQYYSLVLKFNESKWYAGTSKCIFLQEWNAEFLGSEELKGIIARCGIYSCRPINCGAYPAKYDEKEKRVTIRDSHLIPKTEHAEVEETPAYKLCPGSITKEDYSAFTDDYVLNAVSNHYEKEYFMKVAEKWNKNPDVSDNFYDFIVKEYGDRIEQIK